MTPREKRLEELRAEVARLSGPAQGDPLAMTAARVVLRRAVVEEFCGSITKAAQGLGVTHKALCDAMTAPCPACNGRGVRLYGCETEDGCDECEATGRTRADVPEAAPATFRLRDGSLVEGRERCEVNGTKLLPCVPLAHVLGWFDGQRTRLSVGTGYARHHDGEREALMLRHGAKFAPFDFCPFCGASVKTTFAVQGAAS